MEVFGFYDCSQSAPENQPDMVTLWDRSWRNRGWKPRLLTSRHARRSKLFKRWGSDPSNWPMLAMHAVGGGWLVPFQVINFSLPPVEKGKFYLSRNRIEQLLKGTVPHTIIPVINYPLMGWPDESLVFFDKPAQVLNCGRTI